ncbi:unnamed protein product [Toxocara canis]|uniref:FAT domain-containing protein n=1 Tax=Toxocara canis TaxID=6265 RepID=A0A183U2S1_TOXCA|nr:unnamed protein product [Toxocara canis]
MHQMRCMEALGRWNELNAFSKKAFSELAPNVEPERKQKMSIIAARGSWAVGDWETMDWYVQQINENSQDGSFLRAVLALRKEQYADALAYISKVRDMSDAELTAMASESYERAYGAMTLVQQLTELEEAIEYNMWPERRARIAVVWSRRLQGCRQNVEHWQRLLLVRSLVLSMKEMRPLWIKFSSLCRRQGKLTMSHRILTSLLGLGHNNENIKLHEVGSLPMDKPSLVLAICKQLWIEKHEILACNTLEALVMQLERDKTMVKMSPELSHLAAKCCLKLGEWYDVISSTRTSQQPLVAVGVPPSVNPVMMGVASLMIGTNHPLTPTPPVVSPPTHNQAVKFYSTATSYDPNWYKAWHRLASAYFNSAIYQPKTEASHSLIDAQCFYCSTMSIAKSRHLASYFKVLYMPIPSPVVQPVPAPVLTPLGTSVGFAPLSPVNGKTPVDMMLAPQMPISPSVGVAVTGQNTIFFAVQAVKCFVKAITLAEGSRLEDTLRFLTLWFKHGDHVEVFENIRESLKILPVEMWLEVRISLFFTMQP